MQPKLESALSREAAEQAHGFAHPLRQILTRLVFGWWVRLGQRGRRAEQHPHLDAAVNPILKASEELWIGAEECRTVGHHVNVRAGSLEQRDPVVLPQGGPLTVGAGNFVHT